MGRNLVLLVVSLTSKNLTKVSMADRERERERERESTNSFGFLKRRFMVQTARASTDKTLNPNPLGSKPFSKRI